MKKLFTRILTGVIFIGVVLFCISWNQYSTAALFLVFSTLGTIEFYQILERNELSQNLRYGTSTNILVYSILTLIFIDKLDITFLAISIPWFIILVLIELFYNNNIPYQNISSTLFALFYITVPFSALNFLSFNHAIYQKIDLDTDWSLLAGYFIILWTNDSMAYLTGNLIGKHKLFEKISPGKTWEGFIGGVAFALLAGYVFAIITGSSTTHWAIIASIIAIFGTLGDLSESLLKRSGDVKDSGNLLPGHGGVLDRFDGILLSAPLVLVYLMYI